MQSKIFQAYPYKNREKITCYKKVNGQPQNFALHFMLLCQK